MGKNYTPIKERVNKAVEEAEKNYQISSGSSVYNRHSNGDEVTQYINDFGNILKGEYSNRWEDRLNDANKLINEVGEKYGERVQRDLEGVLESVGGHNYLSRNYLRSNSERNDTADAYIKAIMPGVNGESNFSRAGISSYENSGNEYNDSNVEEFPAYEDKSNPRNYEAEGSGENPDSNEDGEQEQEVRKGGVFGFLRSGKIGKVSRWAACIGGMAAATTAIAAAGAGNQHSNNDYRSDNSEGSYTVDSSGNVGKIEGFAGGLPIISEEGNVREFNQYPFSQASNDDNYSDNQENYEKDGKNTEEKDKSKEDNKNNNTRKGKKSGNNLEKKSKDVTDKVNDSGKAKEKGRNDYESINSTYGQFKEFLRNSFSITPQDSYETSTSDQKVSEKQQSNSNKEDYQRLEQKLEKSIESDKKELSGRNSSGSDNSPQNPSSSENTNNNDRVSNPYSEKAQRAIINEKSWSELSPEVRNELKEKGTTKENYAYTESNERSSGDGEESSSSENNPGSVEDIKSPVNKVRNLLGLGVASSLEKKSRSNSDDSNQFRQKVLNNLSSDARKYFNSLAPQTQETYINTMRIKRAVENNTLWSDLNSETKEVLEDRNITKNQYQSAINGETSENESVGHRLGAGDDIAKVAYSGVPSDDKKSPDKEKDSRSNETKKQKSEKEGFGKKVKGTFSSGLGLLSSESLERIPAYANQSIGQFGGFLVTRPEAAVNDVQKYQDNIVGDIHRDPSENTKDLTSRLDLSGKYLGNIFSSKTLDGEEKKAWEYTVDNGINLWKGTGGNLIGAGGDVLGYTVNKVASSDDNLESISKRHKKAGKEFKEMVGEKESIKEQTIGRAGDALNATWNITGGYAVDTVGATSEGIRKGFQEAAGWVGGLFGGEKAEEKTEKSLKNIGKTTTDLVGRLPTHLIKRTGGDPNTGWSTTDILKATGPLEGLERLGVKNEGDNTSFDANGNDHLGAFDIVGWVPIASQWVDSNDNRPVSQKVAELAAWNYALSEISGGDGGGDGGESGGEETPDVPDVTDPDNPGGGDSGNIIDPTKPTNPNTDPIIPPVTPPSN